MGVNPLGLVYFKGYGMTISSIEKFDESLTIVFHFRALRGACDGSMGNGDNEEVPWKRKTDGFGCGEWAFCEGKIDV